MDKYTEEAATARAMTKYTKDVLEYTEQMNINSSYLKVKITPRLIELLVHNDFNDPDNLHLALDIIDILDIPMVIFTYNLSTYNL